MKEQVSALMNQEYEKADILGEDSEGMPILNDELAEHVRFAVRR